MTCYWRLLRVSWRQHLFWKKWKSRVDYLELSDVGSSAILDRLWEHRVYAPQSYMDWGQNHISGTRPRGRPIRRWTDDIREWTGTTIVECIRTAEDKVVRRAVTCASTASNLQQSGKTSSLSYLAVAPILRRPLFLFRNHANLAAFFQNWTKSEFTASHGCW